MCVWRQQGLDWCSEELKSVKMQLLGPSVELQAMLWAVLKAVLVAVHGVSSTKALWLAFFSVSTA